MEVSIITTSMNYGRYLENCIQSVHAQRRYRDAKINHIVMDGGSTDETHATLNRNRGKLSYYINEGEGQTPALNHALQIIEDEFPDTTHIGWINADDFYKEYWLAESHKVLSREPDDVALVCADIVLFGQLGGGRTTWGMQRYFDKSYFCRFGNTVSQPTVLIRFPAFQGLRDRTGFYFNPDYDFCQDLELWVRFIENGYRIRHIPRLTAYLRLHPGQMGRVSHEGQCRELDFIVRRICGDLNMPPPAWVREWTK